MSHNMAAKKANQNLTAPFLPSFCVEEAIIVNHINTISAFLRGCLPTVISPYVFKNCLQFHPKRFLVRFLWNFASQKGIMV